MCYQSGVIKIGVNPFVLPYFLEIKERFTEFNLRYLIAIGSSYGIKLYKLLKQYQSIGNRELTIEEMRNQFGLDINKYKLYSGFKRDVIEIAKKHINLHTDIQINYEEIKHGRKVQKIKFYIKTKIPQFKQAQIAFLDWAINSDFNNLRNILKDADSIKKDPFHFTMVKESLEWFLTNKVFNYDPNSCEPLQYYGTDTLFGQ
jgi:plasmid replication initiation protein